MSGALLTLWALAGAAHARPDDGDLFSWSDTDVIEHLDLDASDLRVHYSVAGPHAVDPDDDLPQRMGDATADVLATFDAWGFLPPVAEATLGLDGLGGSDAFDVYLVDFGGAADGRFAVDACSDVPRTCAGHVVVENDFAGYGYASLDVAIDTLASHELFHAVQAAYEADLPTWVSEGTAVWAEVAYDPASEDFLRFADAYLADISRSLDRPPSGPVASFAYGTGVWWDHLARRHGVGSMARLLELLERSDDAPVDPREAVATLLTEYDDTLVDAWTDFAVAMAATGSRSGILPGPPYAAALVGPTPQTDGAVLQTDLRVFPWSVRYDRLRPAPSSLALRLTEPDPAVQVLVLTEDAEGRLTTRHGPWDATDLPDRLTLDGSAAWIVLAHPDPWGASMKGSLCAGAPGDCEDDSDTDPHDPDEGAPACAGCHTGRPSPALLGLWWLLVLSRRRSPPNQPVRPRRRK